jgi:heat shock protein HtpX
VYSEIASNKRRSVIFVVVFFVLWLAIGAACGLLFKAIYHPAVNPEYPSAPATNYGWTPVIVGIAIGGALALGGIVYSLNAGAGLVLRVSGAVPADPAQYQQLHNLVEALAIGEGIPKPAVYVIDDPSPNAFATGVSPEKAAITFTTGLLAIMNREELEGITSHEMSHIKNHDIRLLLVVGTMIGMAALLASILWRSAFFSGGGRGRGNQLVLVLFAAGALLAVVGFIFGPLIRLGLSRRRESLADVSGVELTRNPAGLLSALKKLQQNDKPFKNMNHSVAAMGRPKRAVAGVPTQVAEYEPIELPGSQPLARARSLARSLAFCSGAPAVGHPAGAVTPSGGSLGLVVLLELGKRLADGRRAARDCGCDLGDGQSGSGREDVQHGLIGRLLGRGHRFASLWRLARWARGR